MQTDIGGFAHQEQKEQRIKDLIALEYAHKQEEDLRKQGKLTFKRVDRNTIKIIKVTT